MIFNFRSTKDAETLQGHGAEYFATAEDTKAVKIKGTINTLFTPTEEGTWFVTNCGDGTFPYAWGLLEIRYGSYELEYVATFKSTGDDKRLYYNVFRNGVWSGWEKVLTSAGGTVYSENSPHPLIIDNGDTTNNMCLIPFRKQGSNLGFLGFDNKSNPIILSDTGWMLGTILHTGNLANHAIAKNGGNAIHAINILEDETGTKPSSMVMTTNNGVSFLINADTDGVKRQLSISPRANAPDKNYCLEFHTNESGQWETFGILHTSNSARVHISPTAPSDASALWVY